MVQLLSRSSLKWHCPELGFNVWAPTQTRSAVRERKTTEDPPSIRKVSIAVEMEKFARRKSAEKNFFGRDGRLRTWRGLSSWIFCAWMIPKRRSFNLIPHICESDNSILLCTCAPFPPAKLRLVVFWIRKLSIFHPHTSRRHKRMT